MNKELIFDYISESPIIMAVKNEEELDMAIEDDSKIVFLLFGNIVNIGDYVKKIKQNNKYAIVHVDLIDGLAAREISVEFIKKYTGADGIISTRINNIKRAKELNLFTIFRIFIIDSMSLENLETNIMKCTPDMVEILPGLITPVIQKINEKIKTPIIAGGLISDKHEIIDALNAGAMCISSTNPDVWNL